MLVIPYFSGHHGLLATQHNVIMMKLLTARMSLKPWLSLVILISGLFIYNEFLVYYLVLLQCSWPKLDSGMLDLGVGTQHHGEVKALILADTHLLGSRDGHWFDKLRR